MIDHTPELHADSTGHLHRCAKVNGVWHCSLGCAIQRATVAEAQAQRNELAMQIQQRLRFEAEAQVARLRTALPRILAAWSNEFGEDVSEESMNRLIERLTLGASGQRVAEPTHLDDYLQGGGKHAQWVNAEEWRALNEFYQDACRYLYAGMDQTAEEKKALRTKIDAVEQARHK